MKDHFALSGLGDWVDDGGIPRGRRNRNRSGLVGYMKFRHSTHISYPASVLWMQDHSYISKRCYSTSVCFCCFSLLPFGEFGVCALRAFLGLSKQIDSFASSGLLLGRSRLQLTMICSDHQSPLCIHSLTSRTLLESLLF